MTPQLAAALANDRNDAAWSLESGLAAATRGRGMMFVALPAPIVPVAAVLAAWPASSPAVAWSSGDLALVGLGVAYELRGCGDARWDEVVAAARRLGPDRAIIGGAAVAPSALGFARPRFVGGAAFAPGTADRGPWTGFGDAWFALPRWTYVHDGAHAWLVLAVEPREARDGARWLAEHATLRAALDAPAPVKLQPPMREVERGDAAAWRAQVTDITDAIARGGVAKIVAARTCVVTLDGDARPADLLAALDERHAECARVLVRPPGGGSLIAATPERLVRRDGDEVACDALAGTIARDAQSARDTLRASGKDRREHDLVVRAIADALSDVAEVSRPDEPGVRELRHMLHLHTPIRAKLHEPRHVLELAARLHPTPAVGGTPTALAVPWIAAHEPAARGWYAAPVGWFDLDGNGELAVAIRSGLLAGTRVLCGPAPASSRAAIRIASSRRPTSSCARCSARWVRRHDRARDGRADAVGELLAATLADAGVRLVVLSPGSRSTPIAAAVAAEPRLELVTIIDERAAAFFALGAARATGVPAAIACTSGSAAAHYLPAIVEASAACVPLVVITADRPPELHACGANQTIDQIKMYGAFARGAFDLGAPEGSELALRALRRKIVQAVVLARGPHPGPVHLEVPLRKPLEPAPPTTDAEHALARVVAKLRAQPIAAAAPTLVADPRALDELVAAIAAEPHGVIVAGALPIDRTGTRDAIAALAARTGYPILAETGSQLRFGGARVIRHAELVRGLAPRLAIQLGAEPLAAIAADARWVLAPHAWQDPDSSARGVILGDSLVALVARCPDRGPSEWTARWRAADARAADALDRAIAMHPRNEIAAVRAAIEASPGAQLQCRQFPARARRRSRGARR